MMTSTVMLSALSLQKMWSQTNTFNSLLSSLTKKGQSQMHLDSERNKGMLYFECILLIGNDANGLFY